MAGLVDTNSGNYTTGVLINIHTAMQTRSFELERVCCYCWEDLYMRGGFLFLDHVHNSAEVYQHLAAEVGSSADRGRSLLVNMPSWHSDSQSSNKSLKLWLMDDTCVSPFCLPSGSCTFMYTLIWSPSGKDSAMDCEVGVQVDPCSRCQCRPKVCLQTDTDNTHQSGNERRSCHPFEPLQS